MKLFDSTLGVLERALDVRLVRQNVLAGNIANANTPGYVPQELDFRSALAAAEGGGVNGPPASSFVQAQEAAPGLDGNKVDLDRTLVALAENALQYGASARTAAKKLAILRLVASDGNA
jgi:flagellar basal-body rod protein FlgB